MITNRWFCGIENAQDARMVRESVFVREQGFAEEDEFDALDAQAMHVVIYDDNAPVGTGRVYHDGKNFGIGRICVLKAARGGGIGDLLMRVLLVKVFEFCPSQVCILAQVQARGFYEKFGFAACGEQVDEAGIPHIPMLVNKET
ncbi:MAG: GNAT family N-acetyltransferase, partial [Christensenella sp.]